MVQSERPGATERGQKERIAGAQHVVFSDARALRQHRRARFREHVHAVVAGDRVGTQRDGDATVDHLEHARGAVTELGIRHRTVRDRSAMARHGLDVSVIEPHAVDEQRACRENAGALENVDR